MMKVQRLVDRRNEINKFYETEGFVYYQLSIFVTLIFIVTNMEKREFYVYLHKLNDSTVFYVQMVAKNTQKSILVQN